MSITGISRSAARLRCRSSCFLSESPGVFEKGRALRYYHTINDLL